MNYLVVYPGRFQPWHRGHKATYDYIAKKFGAENVYVATSDVQAPVSSPFSFADKVKMITKTGIPSGRIARVKNPYQAQELTAEVPDPENTALIFAISEKDMQSDNPRFKFGVKKNGEPSYMQPMPADLKSLKPLTQHAYVFVTPTVNFKVRGQEANSATQIRKQYMDGNDNDRDQILTDLYGDADPALKAIFDRGLLPAKKLGELTYGTPIVDANVMDSPPLRESREFRSKMSRLLESVLRAERIAQQAYAPMVEDLVENLDYLDEK